jgi:hypothetical protein
VQHEHTEHVAAAPDAVFGAISDIRNSRGSCRRSPRRGRRRATSWRSTLVMWDASSMERRRFTPTPLSAGSTWSSASGYRGWMSVAPDGEGSRITLFLETRHGSERDYDIAGTLDAIRMLVESEV